MVNALSIEKTQPICYVVSKSNCKGTQHMRFHLERNH